MQYSVNFGRLSARDRAATGSAFRIALLGDFSARSMSASIPETGEALARRKSHVVDVDALDGLVTRLSPKLNLTFGDTEKAFVVPLSGFDDFHPDQLVENVPVMQALLDLRRGLQTRGGFDRAAKEVLSWAGEEALPPPPTRRARGTTIATDRKLSDFARLMGRPAVAEASADDLIRRLVGPYVVPERDARQEALVARVDAALSDAMRRILHHPDFQAAETLWRGLEFLVRRLETGERMQIVLYDISAEEFAADLSATDALEDSALHALLVEQPALDAYQGGFSLIAALYEFEVAPPHADLLGRAAQIAAAAGAPFIAGLGSAGLQVAPNEWHPLTRQAWAALRGLSAAAYLGVATPRFLLRYPYGQRTDPIGTFDFEEFTREQGLRGMLWGNAALLPACLIAQSWLRDGNPMRLGSHATIGELPVFVYEDTDGEPIALPCTNRLLTERQAVQVASYGAMPLVSLRGRGEVRVASFGSLLTDAPLAGRWAPASVQPPAEPVPPKTVQGAPVATLVPARPAPIEAAAPTAAVVPPKRDAAPPDSSDPAAMGELAALLKNLETPEPVGTPPPTSAEPGNAGADAEELDALLANLSAEPPPASPGAVEADLDALLASLK
jgi:type VI secretion system protein ImpC